LNAASGRFNRLTDWLSDIWTLGPMSSVQWHVVVRITISLVPGPWLRMIAICWFRDCSISSAAVLSLISSTGPPISCLPLMKTDGRISYGLMINWSDPIVCSKGKGKWKWKWKAGQWSVIELATTSYRYNNFRHRSQSVADGLIKWNLMTLDCHFGFFLYCDSWASWLPSLYFG